MHRHLASKCIHRCKRKPDAKFTKNLYAGILGTLTSAHNLRRNFTLWKHLITAGRSGNEDIRLAYLANMGLQAIYLLGFFLLWYFGRQWLFPTFNPMSYWDINGNFFESIITISTPIFLYAFFLGQLDWFGSSDDYEENTVVAESLPFKWAVSLGAGVFEELSHRGYMVYAGLIMVSVFNLYASWIIPAVIFLVVMGALAKADVRFGVFVITLSSVGYGLFSMRDAYGDNIILRFNAFILTSFSMLAENQLLTYLVLGGAMAIFLGINFLTPSEKRRWDANLPEYLLRISAFTAWAGYIFPLGIKIVAKLPIVPAGSDYWTKMLYISAVLWSNAKFRDGHKYQGCAGMLNSYLIGFYMFYICFTHGLLYAVVVHFIFDAVLFSSEHAVEVIKRLPFVRARNSYYRP
ncbi:hypothetical protein HGA64_00910 [Candidatus Falkowbacteria bacterium]|nr:hypothetical protein [Candidatus Falkowbacteria bacterium]